MSELDKPYWKQLFLNDYVETKGILTVQYYDFFDSSKVADVSISDGTVSLYDNLDEEIAGDHALKAFIDSLEWSVIPVNADTEKKWLVLEHSFYSTFVGKEFPYQSLKWKFYVPDTEGGYVRHVYEIERYNEEFTVTIPKRLRNERKSLEFSLENNPTRAFEAIRSDITDRLKENFGALILH